MQCRFCSPSFQAFSPCLCGVFVGETSRFNREGVYSWPSLALRAGQASTSLCSSSDTGFGATAARGSTWPAATSSPVSDHQKENQRMSEKAIGTVTHYFSKIRVAGIRITDGTLRAGDRIHVEGHTSDFTQSDRLDPDRRKSGRRSGRRGRNRHQGRRPRPRTRRGLQGQRRLTPRSAARAEHDPRRTLLEGLRTSSKRMHSTSRACNGPRRRRARRSGRRSPAR